MDSKTYWEKREAEQLKNYIKDEKEYDKQIKQIYANMLDSVQEQIDSFYGQYADKEGISIAEAKKRVSSLNVKRFERKAKRYVREKNFSKHANDGLRLYNATMKINRLEMLKANIGLELISGHDELERYMGGILQGRTEEELARQAGILGKTVRNNAKTAHAIVNGSFQVAKVGDQSTFSDRIWQYQDLMREDLGRLLQTALIQGKNPRAVAKDLKKYWYGADPKTGGGATYCMERLMRTELARVQTEAQKQSFERNEFEEYMFISNEHGHTCEQCNKLDGKHFKVKDMMPGLNAPPMHPNCRCSTAAWVDDDEYEAWLDYLDKGGTTKEWEASGKSAWKKQQKSKTPVEKAGNGSIIKLADTLIRKGVGAKPKNYDIVDPATGEIFHFVEGTRIQNSEAFAGYGTRKPLDEGVPEGLADQEGGVAEKWRHCKGDGIIDYYGEERPAEVHWFQEETVGKVKFKIKRWKDES